MTHEDATPTAWRADFRAAEERRREAALSVSAAERLRWLEEALRFAAKVRALRREHDRHGVDQERERTAP